MATSYLHNKGFLENQNLKIANKSIWFLGLFYKGSGDQKLLNDDVITRFWFSYRKNFFPIGNEGLTSDQGWGCMIRCGQMMMAHALVCIRLGREWRWEQNLDPRDIKVSQISSLQLYNQILQMFLDQPNSTFSIHQIATTGALDGKSVGEWFGPNTIAHVLKKLSLSDIKVHVCMDNLVIIDEIVEKCKISTKEKKYTKPPTTQSIDGQNKCFVFHSSHDNPSLQNFSSWHPLLLIIPMRLGVSSINKNYYESLTAFFQLPQSAGVLGGRPNHAYWFVGFSGKSTLYYFDPHTLQNSFDIKKENNLDIHSTFHLRNPSSLKIEDLDPSIAAGFWCKTEEDFESLCSRLHLLTLSNCPIFEIVKNKPQHKTSSPSLSQSSFTDSTDDFEHLKLDDDFEII